MSDQTPPPPPPPGEPAAAPPEPATPAPAPVVHKERKWTPLVGVILVMAFVAVGGYVLAGEPQQVGPIEPTFGDPITVTQDLSIRPIEGWTPGDSLSLELSDIGVTLDGLRIDGGAGHLDVVAAPGAGDPVNIWNLYVQEFLSQEADQLRSSQELESFTTDAGVQGVRGYYVGVFPGVASPLEGEISAIVMPDGLGVIADGWAPEGQLGAHQGDMRAMVNTAQGG